MTKINIVVSGDTYSIKDKLKEKGFSFDGRNREWKKIIEDDTAIQETKSLVFAHLITPKKQSVTIEAIKAENRRAAYDTQTKIESFWMYPSKTVYQELKERGYEDYPFLNHLSYKICVTGEVILLSDPPMAEKIKEYQESNPTKKLPRYE